MQLVVNGVNSLQELKEIKKLVVKNKWISWRLVFKKVNTSEFVKYNSPILTLFRQLNTKMLLQKLIYNYC
ncbi:hypothetical protein SRED_002189 [Spiroplasma melliferum]|uniref:Spiroplasmavirus-related protein n=1 Tax=Spiroplasma melliferum TaxID=2134 RepID=A0ABX5UB26_SPIME|nr:hypothetical protein SRED_002189 [Spiroplasma melliferum]